MPEKQIEIKPNGKELSQIETMIDKETVKTRIIEIRGKRVMLDQDVALFFAVETGALNRAMKRNSRRFPESFCFQLTDDELSRCQIGISMQRQGKRGGRTYNPYVYSEQGIAMLTSVLHTDKAIEASVIIIEAFIEMSHFLHSYSCLFPHQELYELENRQLKLETKFKSLEKRMVTKNDLTRIMTMFEEGSFREEILILDGKPFTADVIYQRIYRKATKSIHIIDDYINLKTLHLLSNVRQDIDITIISDNVGGNLHLSDYEDCRKEKSGFQARFIRNNRISHDRFIIIDYGTETEKLFSCGSSSKDSGNRMTTIMQFSDPDISAVFDKKLMIMLKNPPLVLR